MSLRDVRWSGRGSPFVTRAIVGALAFGGLAIVPPAHSSPTAGCDNSRPGVTHGPGVTTPRAANVVPCLTFTFPDFGESGIVVTPPAMLSNGATAPSAVMHSATKAPDSTTYPSEGGVARTVDEGAHWQNVTFSATHFGDLTSLETRCGADSGFFRDPFTNRVFFYADSGCKAVLAGFNISFTDDNGETWVDNPGPALQFFPSSDAAVMFGGPPRVTASQDALSAAGYRNVVYLCASGSCFKSLDGGINFTAIPGTGFVAAGPDGTLYGNPSSGKVNVSYDEGATSTQLAGTVPTGFAVGCTRPSGEGSLRVDEQSDIYLGGTYNGQLAVTYSTDGGTNWAGPIQLQMPGVSGIDRCSFAADWNRPGHIAMTYFAGPAPPLAEGVGPIRAGLPSDPHHGYLTKTDDLFGLNGPVEFTSVQVDSDADPLLPYGYPSPAPSPSAKSVGARDDYISVTFSPVDGSAWAVLFKDQCSTFACASDLDPDDVDPNNPNKNPNNIRETFWTNLLGAVATMTTP